MKTIGLLTSGGDSPGMNAAVKSAIEGHDKVMVGVVNNHIKLTPLKMTWSKKIDIDFDIVELAKTLR